VHLDGRREYTLALARDLGRETAACDVALERA